MWLIVMDILCKVKRLLSLQVTDLDEAILLYVF